MVSRIGLVGLGVMGANLALNIAEQGFPVAVYNRTFAQTESFMAGAGDLARRLTPARTYPELAAALGRPRAIILMVPAGDPVDQVIGELLPLLEQGDMIIDAGNANFHDTRRREAALRAKGFAFIGMGVSGGEEGARHGPSIMVGGPAESYPAIRDVVEAISAKYRGAPCVAHLGPDGAGHFVKTVHNGIEYGDMQMIAEVWGLLRDGMEARAADAAEMFEKWNSGRLKSFLVEITGEILSTRDPKTGRPVVDVILDRAGQKGTGRWTVIEALQLGQSASTIEAAVGARSWSAAKAARQTGAALFAGPETGPQTRLDLPGEALENALLAAKIIAYSQGFSLLAAASEHYDWALDMAVIAEIWRAGCIIRSAMLDDMAAAARAGLPDGMLIFAPGFARILGPAIHDLRKVVAAAAGAGLPVPAFSAALAYFDTMRQARGTTDLIQAQRDFFGAHGFERVDGGAGQHGPWGSGVAA